MRKLLVVQCVMLFLVIGYPLSVCYAGIMGGVDTTPSEFEVTVSKIEFRNDSGSWVEFAAGSFVFDLADGVNPNETVGQIAESAQLVPDTYTTMRITFSRTFGITAAAIDGAFRGRTKTGNPANQAIAGPGLTNVGLPEVDAASATKQQLPVPAGGAVPALLAANNITEAGADLIYQTATNFTVTKADQLPTITINFDVTNSVEIRVDNPAAAYIIPLPPTVSVTVS